MLFTLFNRFCSYEQKQPQHPKQSPYARLLAARDTAFVMMLVLSQILPYHDKDLGACSPIAIVRDHIVPRIQRTLVRIERDRSLEPDRRYDSASGQVSEREYEMRVAHIELMIWLVKNRDSFDSRFWASVSRWQIGSYRRFGEKLLRDYKEAMFDMPEDKEEAEVFIGALEKAVGRAHALPEPDAEKAQFSDVFAVRNIYDDPDIKALVNSDRFTPEKRLVLQEAVEDLLSQQPMFPPECYALPRV